MFLLMTILCVLAAWWLCDRWMSVLDHDPNASAVAILVSHSQHPDRSRLFYEVTVSLQSPICALQQRRYVRSSSCLRFLSGRGPFRYFRPHKHGIVCLAILVRNPARKPCVSIEAALPPFLCMGCLYAPPVRNTP